MKKRIRFIALALGLFLLTGCGDVFYVPTDEERAQSALLEQEDEQSSVALELTGDEREGVFRIALIDSGISYEAIPAKYIATGKNYVDVALDTDDTLGHGTAVASIIADYAPNDNYVFVPLISTMFDKGRINAIDSEALAVAIREAVDTYHCDLINISAGVENPNEALEAAVLYATEQGVTVVAAVGNDYEENPGALIYPAAYECVVSVGALNSEGERAEFSQDWADEYALGVDVLYSLPSGAKDVDSATSYATAVYSASLIPN